MGKKSKRNRAVSKTQRSDPPDMNDIVGKFSRLLDKDDYEGLAKVEADVRQATLLETTDPGLGGCIYYNMAKALYDKCNGIASSKVIHYMERSFTLLVENTTIMDRSTSSILTSSKEYLRSTHSCVMFLVTLYIQEEKYDQALATVKRFIASISHEFIDPKLILDISFRFRGAFQFQPGVVDILTTILGTINTSWSTEDKASSYTEFGQAYTYLFEYEKSLSFFQKALSITEDSEMKVEVLAQLGYMHRCSCNYKKGLAVLNQALTILSAESSSGVKNNSWSKPKLVRIHTLMGEVLSDRGKQKYDLQALEHFEFALGIIKEGCRGVYEEAPAIYQGLGSTHARLGNWDEANKALNLDFNEDQRANSGSDNRSRNNSVHTSILCRQIGKVCLDQYCSDDRLLHDTQKREKILKQVEFSTWKSFEWYDGGGGGAGTSDDYLNWAQLKYFLGEIEEAKEYLMMYFKKEMKKEGEFCRECGRRAEKGTKISMCSICEVVDYCSKTHQKLAWNRGRLRHKVMCPFLKRWRGTVLAKAENRLERTESFEDICQDLFETVCVLKYESEN